jgi:hypothetical protein
LITADAILLVVLALVSPVLGLLWVDHARNIGDIAEFIRRSWRWKPNWEATSVKVKAEAQVRFYIFASAMTIIFLIPAIGGLIASIGDAGWPGPLAAWIAAAGLTGLYVFGWGAQLWRSWPRKESTR